MTHAEKVKAIVRRLPTPVQTALAQATIWRNVDWNRGTSHDETGEFVKDQRWVVEDPALGEAISSLIRSPRNPDKDHFVLIDLDVNAAIIPSSTSGHGHLYIDHPVSWEHMERLLEVLVDMGIVEKGYLEASRTRRQTFLRLPWVKKGRERHQRGWTPEEVEEFLNPTPITGDDAWADPAGRWPSDAPF